MAVFWIGQDGNIWLKTDSGQVKNMGQASAAAQVSDMGVSGAVGSDSQSPMSFEAQRIADPNPPQQISFGGSGGGDVVDPNIAVRNKLREEITSKGSVINDIYDALFGKLDALVKARGKDLESQYGDQLKKATDQYSSAIPQIETSYAALGAGDSTDQSDAKTGAKKGFDDTTKTIGKNKQADEAKLGQYRSENRAKFEADQNSAKRNINRAGETEDVGALREMRNNIESNIDAAKVTRATLDTDKGARGELSRITQDNGRFDAAINALDSIIKSSMSGSVKQAAVQAIADSAGLSDQEKKKIQQQYGNVYAEQAAL